MKRSALSALLITGLFCGTGAEAGSLNELRTQLQATLQRSLGRSMLGGALPHVDLRTGKVTRYYPTENHEIILELGDIYVMCATLVTENGREARSTTTSPKATGASVSSAWRSTTARRFTL